MRFHPFLIRASFLPFAVGTIASLPWMLSACDDANDNAPHPRVSTGGRGGSSLNGGAAGTSFGDTAGFGGTNAAGTGGTMDVVDGGAGGVGGSSGAAGAAGTGGSASAPLPIVQGAAVLTASNNGEIQRSNLAGSRNTNTPVKNFALMMVTDHTAANVQQAKLLQNVNVTPEANAVSQQITSQNAQGVTNLTSRTGSDFDKAYINA